MAHAAEGVQCAQLVNQPSFITTDLREICIGGYGLCDVRTDPLKSLHRFAARDAVSNKVLFENFGPYQTLVVSDGYTHRRKE
jgi:hypothetical protein